MASSARASARPRPSLLLFLTSVLLLVCASSGVAAQQCDHYTEDALLARLESHFALCMREGVHPQALETLKDRFATNEFDRRHPLALVLFSNSTELLATLSASVASALFGSSRSPHSVQSVDLQELLATEPRSNYAMKNTLRAALATPLRSCPQRSLFVLQNIQALDDAALPVLDVFLDPLNGKRAQFQQHVHGQASRVLDCSNSVFLFLYHVSSSRSPLDGDVANWRDFLMQQWTRTQGTLEDFTPQAFVGRLTEAVAVFLPTQDHDAVGANANDHKPERSMKWRRTCELQPVSEEEQAEGSSEDEQVDHAAASLVSTMATATAAMVAFLSVPATLMLLTEAKRWNQETSKKREARRMIHRRTGGRKKRKHRK